MFRWLQYVFTGWDSQEEDGNFPMKLREIQVPIIPIFICNSVLYYFGRLDPLSMICAGSDRADTCQVFPEFCQSFSTLK